MDTKGQLITLEQNSIYNIFLEKILKEQYKVVEKSAYYSSIVPFNSKYKKKDMALRV